MSNRVVVLVVVTCIALFFATGFVVGRMQRSDDQTSTEQLSPEITSTEMESVVAKIRSADLGVPVTARVMYVYSLTIEAEVERWAVSGSFFWEPVAEGHTGMRTKFFLVALRHGDKWGSTDWNISSAEPYVDISDESSK